MFIIISIFICKTDSGYPFLHNAPKSIKLMFQFVTGDFVMSFIFNNLFDPDKKKTTVILLSTGLILILMALIVGVSDNPPGIILLYLGFISLTLMFVHPWHTARPFFILFTGSLIGLPVFAVLHNVWHGLHTLVSDMIVLDPLFQFLSVISFLIALIACPPGVLVGGIGSIIWYFKDKKNKKRVVK